MTNVDFARLIIAALPVQTTANPPADQLALMILLEGHGMTVGDIARALGLPQACASDLVARALMVERVERTRHRFDHRVYQISLAPRGHRELRRARRYRDVTDTNTTTEVTS